MKKKIYILSHTHWDREWNQPFQHFRKRLIDMMDELIETIEADPEYRFFTFDGQTIILEDYLEIKPENKERLTKLIKDGRIIIGPWYVMGDEAMPSGESLVRNLLKGHQIAREYGVGPLKVGYVTDIFGHTGQLPQILRGFGIESALLVRGMGDFMESEFEWEAPDGSKVLGLKKDEDRTYSDFYFAVRWPFFGRDYDKDELVERFKKHLEYINSRSTADVLLMMDGVDNIDVERKLPWILNVLRENFKDVEIIHGTLEQYIQELKANVKNLKCFKGELREPGKNGLNNVVLANVLSSRVHLKQYNVLCERLLENWAEPWGVFGEMTGKQYPNGFLRKAWEYLIMNHPHDSIGGCSMTEVHRDMMYRFDQCKYIGEYITEDALKYISSLIDTDGMTGERTITLFNSSQKDYQGILTVDLETPANPQAPLYFRIFDEQGKEVPHQLLSLKKGQIKTIIQKSLFPQAEVVDIYKAAFAVHIPAYGYVTYSYLHYMPDKDEFGSYSLVNECRPVRYPGTQLISANVAENEFLKVSIRENGTVDVYDKESGHQYSGLLLFEDEADIGDGWVYRSPVDNERVLSFGRQAGISVVHDGPFKTTFRIRQTMLLPKEIAPGSLSRKQEYVEADIVTDLTLTSGERTIQCKTTVDNVARDHRMKLMFPTGLSTDSYFTSNAFDFMKRNIMKKDYSNYREEAAKIVPNHGIVALAGDEGGMAVFNRGLYEAEVRDDRDRTIALTLLRSTRTEVANIIHDGGQILGKHEFEYAMVFYKKGGENPGELLMSYQTFAYGIKALCRHRQKGCQPLKKAFITVDSANVIVSAVKKAESGQGYIIRIYNSGSSKEAAVIKFVNNIRNVNIADLEENITASIPYYGSTCSLEMGPKQIATIMVSFSA